MTGSSTGTGHCVPPPANKSRRAESGFAEPHFKGSRFRIEAGKTLVNSVAQSDIFVDVLGQDVERDVAPLNHCVIEIAEVVAGPECVLGARALPDDLGMA